MSDTITVTGNIATEPELKHTPAGVPITTFRIASSQRRFDRTKNAWVDGATNWYTVSAFRGLADHAYASFRKGHRVLLTGRLRLREWDTGAKKGVTAEIDVDAIGHDLLWGHSTFHRDDRPESVGMTGATPVDSWAADGAGHASTSELDPSHAALSALTQHVAADRSREAGAEWSIPGASEPADYAREPVGAGIDIPF